MQPQHHRNDADVFDSAIRLGDAMSLSGVFQHPWDGFNVQSGVCAPLHDVQSDHVEDLNPTRQNTLKKWELTSANVPGPTYGLRVISLSGTMTST